MADLDLSTITPTVMSGMDSTWFIIEIGIIIILVFAIIFLFWWYFSFKINYRIRTLTGGKTIIYDDKAKRVKGKGGVYKWKLRGRRDFVPIPPDRAIHMTHKGKMSIEAYYTPQHEYKYIDDYGYPETKIIDKSYTYLIDNGITGNEIEGFRALKTNDREFYANEFRMLTQYKKKSISDFILPIAGILGITIIVVCMFAFWGDITKPTLDAQKTNIEVTRVQTDMLVQIKEIMRHAQIVPDYNGTIPEVPVRQG